MRTPNNERLVDPDITGARQADRHKAGEGSERRCILSGEHGARGALVRLALSPDGDVLPDPLARAPGRGAWLGVTRPELETAMAKGRLRAALARAFKGARLNVPDDLPQLIETGLRRALTDRLGLEMRAGFLVLGTERIGEHARGGALHLLLHAADAAPDGTRKLDQAWRVGREAEGSGERGTVLPLDRAALSVALGRDNVVHLALANRRAAERVAVPLQRLLTYLGANDAPADQPASPAGDGARDDARTDAVTY